MKRSTGRLRRGISLIEALIALSITSMLLVATAAAFNASADAVTMNADFFRASQAARISMNQILNEIRRADSVRVATDTYSVDIIRPVDTLTPGEVYRRYQFDSTNHRITLQIFYANDVGGPSYEIASGVTSAAFGPATMGEDYNNTIVVQRVPVLLVITNGNNTIRLDGAAAPRRALKY